MDLTRFIVASVAAYVRAEITSPGLRPIDRKLARAEWLGFCKAADALGIAMTPTHYQMTFIDAHRAVADRPMFSPVNNSNLREWDAALGNDVMRRLDLIGHCEPGMF